MYEIVSWPLLITAALCFTKVVLYQHPVGPWCLTIVPGQLGNFFMESRAGHQGFHGSGALGSFQFFLEHSLATSKNLGVCFNMG